MRYRFAEKLGKALSLYEIRSSKQDKFILHLFIIIIIIIISSIIIIILHYIKLI